MLTDQRLMRNIPQIMRHWILFNTLRSTSISGMMEHCKEYPLVDKIKKILLHDRENAVKEIEYYINQLERGIFQFRYDERRRFEALTIFQEDLGGGQWNKRDMIIMLRELKDWITKQDDYKYPAERYYEEVLKGNM